MQSNNEQPKNLNEAVDGSIQVNNLVIRWKCAGCNKILEESEVMPHKKDGFFHAVGVKYAPGDFGAEPCGPVIEEIIFPYPEVQRRYAAYCVKNGKTPSEMKEYDRKRWPGGLMCGYILWIQESLLKFREKHPEAFTGYILTDHDRFTKFLYE